MPIPFVPFLAIAAASAAATALYKATKSEPTEPQWKPTTTPAAPQPYKPIVADDDTQLRLRINFSKLKMEIHDFKRNNENTPIIAVFGMPGRGKSSLLHSLAKGHGALHPLPQIGAQTDATSWAKPLSGRLIGDWTLPDGRRLGVVDFPGYGTTTHPVQPYIDFIKDNAGCFHKQMFCIDGKVAHEDALFFQALRKQPGMQDRTILVRTKSDGIWEESDKKIIENDLRNQLSWPTAPVHFLSNRVSSGVNELRSMILGSY